MENNKKKRGAPPRVPGHLKKTEVIEVRCSPTEKQLYAQYFESRGMDVSSGIRGLLSSVLLNAAAPGDRLEP